MPSRKVKGGWRWGKHGKVYPTKKEADEQGKAAYASGYKGKADGIEKVLRSSYHAK